MSDIADNGSFVLGLANINSQNFGPTAVANQQLTGAQTQNVQQEAQGQQINNASNALNLQALRIGLSQLYRLPGYRADQTNQSDQSGASSGGSTSTQSRGAVPAQSGGGASSAPAPSAPASSAQGGQPDQSAPVNQGEDDEVGESVSHPELLDTSLRNQFYINPLGTSDEQQNILQAAKVSALTKNPAYVQIATQQRDMAVGQRRLQAQATANTHYSEMAAVADAGDQGNAFDVLQAVAPDSAGKIARMHPKEAGESDSDYKDRLNEVAADTAGHYAGHVFQYTGRETETRSDGVVVDKATGFPVAGVRGSGMSPQQYSDAIDKANAPVDIKNSDGTSTQMPAWKYAQNQGMQVSSAADYVKQKADAQQAIAQHKQMVQDHFTAQRTQQQIQAGIPPQPNTVQSGGAAPQPGVSGAAPQPGVQPGAVPQPGAAGQPPQPKDNGLLPGVNPDALPKIQMAPVRQGTSQTPGDLKTSTDIAAFRVEQLKASNDAYTNDQKEGALLKAAQREAAALAANPRMAGPGSEVAQALAKIRTAVTGQAPDSLVDLGGLDKILLQLGAQNVRQALQGQKITQSEFLMMLGKGNPNTEQPLQTVNKLLQYLGAQNDYDRRFNRTKMAALNRGANPLTVDSDIGAQADRGDYVESRVGVRPPIAGGQSSSGPSSGGATEGAVSTSKSGKPIVFTNGHWQYK